MTSGAFRTEFYDSNVAVRKIRLDDLKVELQSEYEALSLAASADDMLRLQGSISILKELIDVLEKGVTAPAPDAGTSETS